MAKKLNYCDKTWGKDLKFLQNFENKHICQFVEGFGSQRLIKEGYNLFISSYVKDVWTSHDPEECSIFIKAKLGKCIHLIALLQLINHLVLMEYTIIPEDLTCTSVEQQWHRPRGKQIEPTSLTESIFAKPHFERKGKPLMCSFSESHISRPTDEEIKKLSESVKDINQGAPLSYLLSVKSESRCKNTSFGKFQYGTTLSHQLQTEESDLPIKFPVTPLHIQDLVCDPIYHLTSEECWELERNTRCQNNECWRNARKIRLTASDFGAICKRRDINSHFLAEIFSGKNIENVKSVKYGRENEKTARNMYLNIAESNGENIKIFPIGFVVNPGAPFLGCSPDGVVFDNLTNLYGLIEIKCPFSKKNISIDEACQDKKFYLEKNGNVISLKKNTVHYYQVQGQMMVTGLNFCDFIVYNGREIWVTRVKQDKEFCDKMLATLHLFFTSHYENYVNLDY